MNSNCSQGVLVQKNTFNMAMLKFNVHLRKSDFGENSYVCGNNVKWGSVQEFASENI